MSTVWYIGREFPALSAFCNACTENIVYTVGKI